MDRDAPEGSVSSVRIGHPAPDFQARTTMGPRRLSDYRGQWLVLFSHPADFTPVCTSEFIAFASNAEAFARRECALLGLSVDSLFAHVAWVRAIESAFAIKIPFPVAEDPSMEIARGYGMLDPQAHDSATVRMTLIIDPDGIVRLTSTYPLTTGRNVGEILRVLEALQTTDRDAVYTPEGWEPGAAVIDPDTAFTAGADAPDWFFRPLAPQVRS